MSSAWSLYFAWADWRLRATRRFLARNLTGSGHRCVVEIQGGDRIRWWPLLGKRAAVAVTVGATGARGEDFPRVPVRRPGGAALEALLVGAGECLPLRGGQADVVICCEVLEHSPTPAKILSEAARALRPGGVLLVTAPDAEAIASHPFPILGRLGFEELEARSGHVSTIRRSQVTRWALEAGLHLKDQRAIHRRPLGALWWELFAALGLVRRRVLRALVHALWPLVSTAEQIVGTGDGLWMGLAFVKR